MKTRADLLPYQERMVQFIKEHMNCALWADMGLGKTISTLTALSDLKETWDVGKVLIVAPLRVARKVWSDEVKEWEHVKHLRISVIGGTEKERLAAMRVEADIYCINRENWAWLCQQFVIRVDRRLKQIAKWPWDCVVLDESDSFKSQSSERWKWAKRVRRLFPRMIQLTGTPASNGYHQLWAQAFLLDGGVRLGDGEDAFKTRWMEPPGYGQTKWSMRPGAEKEIHKQLCDIVVALRAEDYLDLPPIVNNFIKVELSEKEMSMYCQMEREYILEIAPEKEITAVNGGVLYGKLLQLASGAVFRSINETQREVLHVHDEKVKALNELLEELPTPVMIPYNFIHELDRISRALETKCKKTGQTWRLLKTTQDENDWNTGKVDYLILHPRSAGHGLNLHHSGAKHIVWFGPTPDRALYDQLNARLAGSHRRKGKNIVIHHIIAENTIDELDVIVKLDQRGKGQVRLFELFSDYIGKRIDAQTNS